MITKTLIILSLFTATVGLYVQLSARYDPELIAYWTLGTYVVLVGIYLWAIKEQEVHFDDQD